MKWGTHTPAKFTKRWRLLFGLVGAFTILFVVFLWSTLSWTDCGGPVRDTVMTMHALDQALLIYAAKHHATYPSTAEGLARVSRFLPGEEVPTDAWGNEFLYFSPGTHGHPYEIISLGQDGKEGGEGANVDLHSWDTDD